MSDYYEALSHVTPEDHVVLRTGRLDIKPQERFEFYGRSYYALTYPHGAEMSLGPHTIPVCLGDEFQVTDVVAFPAD